MVVQKIRSRRTVPPVVKHIIPPNLVRAAGSGCPPRRRHVESVEGLVSVVHAGVVLLGRSGDVLSHGLE